MNKLTLALNCMAVRLSDKRRKGNGCPYLCHLYSVVQIVASYGGGEELQVVAALHDAVEDAGLAYSYIEADFGEYVAHAVGQLTEDKSLPWLDRKEAVVEMARTCDAGVGLVLLADKIDNLSCMTREMPAGPPNRTMRWREYWSQFNRGYDDQVWFFESLYGAMECNDQLTHNSDHTGLNTRRALAEFGRLYDVFDRRGHGDA